MKYVVLLIFFLSLLHLPTEAKSPQKEWKLFKETFNKKYKSPEEDQRRFKIFKQHLKNIEKHNRRYERGDETYLQAINRFADITENEFAEIYGVVDNQPHIIYNQNEIINRTDSNETNFDWRDAGGFSPVKDQGHCGSCWIFSVVGNLESYHFRKTGEQVVLSEQFVVDCLSNQTCLGGNPYFVFLFIDTFGIHLESDYPYNANQNECGNMTIPENNVTFEDVGVVQGPDEDLKKGLEDHGPLTTCLYVTPKWMFYKSGIWYHKECAKTTNHCVVIVGYGTENGQDYWLIKNSWGSQWGQDGYIKFARNRHNNYCGLNGGLYIV